jgi:hypothetical protein
MRHFILVCFIAALARVAAAPSTNLHPPADWLPALSDNETFAAARLTSTEQQQIFDQVQATSFDTPDSWIVELRVRRISLGDTDGLLIRGAQLLCGGTGNCQTWLFRRSNQRWSNMFDGQAPVVASVGFVKQTKKVNNVVAIVHVSAGAASWVQFTFDGRFYREVSRGSDDLRLGLSVIPLAERQTWSDVNEHVGVLARGASVT